MKTSPISTNRKKVQVLCICYNSASSIYNTLRTWEYYTDRFCILINGGYEDNYNQVEDTVKELEKLSKPVIKFVEPFIDFSTTRNRLIQKVYSPEYTIIFIDDSYELKTWKNPSPNIDNQAVKIHTGNHAYYSNRIFNYQASYTNEIHEIVQVDNSVISGIIVYDREYTSHKLRRFARLEKQIEILKDKSDPRSKYYTASAYFNLYLSSLCTKEQLINAIFDRLAFEDKGSDEYKTTKQFLGILN